MNKRIVLIDKSETPDYVKYYGCGLGDDIYDLSELQAMPDPDMRRILSLGKGDAAMLVGGSPFKFLQGMYHFGVRNENYADCSKLPRLSIEGGAFVKCLVDMPTQKEIQYFLSQAFTESRVFPGFRQAILHTYDEAMRFIDYMDNMPEGTNYGFDYEASGMPLDVWFELSGASLCTTTFGAFISFTDIRRTTGPLEYRKLLDRLGMFLVKRMSNVWVYNMQYEFQVSHRMLGVDLYDLADASVINVLDGNHLKKFSLKWTGQYVLGVDTWDVDFDKLSDLFDSMYFETTGGKSKKSQTKTLKVTPENYKDTPEWAKICELYPGYVQEFELLISEYWGCPFMNIPSDILGYYCNLDAFYTLMIYEERKSQYPAETFQVFLDNARLGSRLHSSGLYIDEHYRQEYRDECHRMMAWGITYCATARCKIKMNHHSKKMLDLKKLSPVCKKLLSKNMFYGGSALEITKNLLVQNVDTLDTTESGLNEGQLLMTYGPDFAVAFLEIVKDAMKEVKMKGKIDAGIGKKRKIIGVISEKLSVLLELAKFEKDSVKGKVSELEQFLYYENAYNELTEISKTQLSDVNCIPTKIQGFGREFTLLEYSDFVSDSYFKCKSPIENDKICEEFAEIYRAESAFCASLFQSVRQMPGEEKFYQNLGITGITDAFHHFMAEWKDYTYQVPRSYSYPQKAFDLALEYWRNPTTDKVKDVWSNFDGYDSQTMFFKDLNDLYEFYGQPFEDSDLGDNFFFMRKLVISYLLYKKYAKVLSTYIEGMFKANNMWVIEGPDHIPLRKADPSEPGAVEKCFVHYEVNTKSSKRWSSGFHTIISHSDLKDCLVTCPAWDEYGNLIPGGGDQMMSYFDINVKIVSLRGDLKKN